MPERPAPARKPVSHPSSSSLRPSASPRLSPAVHSHAPAGGQALDHRTNTEMSARFGHDFSSVRIHADSRAGESAQAFGANAYTLGSDIVFGEGRYQPGSSDTERLLAHELTHVVQQAQLGGGDWSRPSSRGDASEREADSLAAQVLMGRSVQVQAAPGAAIARDEDNSDVGPVGHFFGADGSGSWIDKLGGFDRTKSFQESWLDGLLGPESYAHGQEGDSDLKTLSRAGYSAVAGMAAGVAVPAADLLDTLAYGPFGIKEEQVKQKPDSEPPVFPQLPDDQQRT